MRQLLSTGSVTFKLVFWTFRETGLGSLHLQRYSRYCKLKELEDSSSHEPLTITCANLFGWATFKLHAVTPVLSLHSI